MGRGHWTVAVNREVGGVLGMVVVVVVMVVVMVDTACGESNSDSTRSDDRNISKLTLRNTYQTSGLFVLAKSCGAREQDRTLVKVLHVTKQVWVMTNPTATLLPSGNQTHCALPPKSIFEVRRTDILQVIQTDSEDILCSYKRDTDLYLRDELVYVSCHPDEEDAKEEMFSLMLDSSITSDSSMAPTGGSTGATGQTFPTSALPPSARPPTHHPPTFHHPTPANSAVLNASTENSNSETKATKTLSKLSATNRTSRMPGTTEFTNTVDTITTENTDRTLTSTSNAPEISTQETEAESTPYSEQTEITQAFTSNTEESPIQARNGKNIPFPLTTAIPEVSSLIVNLSYTEAITNETQLALQNSSGYLEQTNEMPFFIGVGTGVAVLVLGIVVIACLVRQRKPKRKNETNNEDFFMVGSYNDSLNRREFNDGYNNAQIMMYSGAEHEEAVSLDMEERILRSQVSSYGQDTPKCLRSDRIKAESPAKSNK
nr:uncharacterized protein LOC128698816 [Cherax quadricarinatus]